MNQATVDPEIQLHHFEHRSAIPMLILSICFVPVLIIPMLLDLTPEQLEVMRIWDHALWGIFVIEYTARFYLARNRLRFVTRNLIDLAIIALPLLRPLRVVGNVRILQAGRVVLAGFRGRKLGDSIVNHHSVTATAFVIASLTVTAAAMVYNVERYSPHSKIHSVGDAFWWAIVTVSTVGYGDFYPVTTEGRVIAGCLMFVGVSTSALIAAAFASVFIKVRNEEEFDPKLAALAQRLDRIDHLLIRLENTVQNHEEKAVERESHTAES